MYKGTECQPCTGSRRTDGYYSVHLAGKNYQEHRVAYCLDRGVTLKSIDGLHVRHLCHNRACCNPAHLDEGTAKDNKADSVRDGVYAFPVMHGQDNPAAKITTALVLQIRNEFSGTYRGEQADLARKYKLTPQHINDVIRGKKWRHVLPSL